VRIIGPGGIKRIRKPKAPEVVDLTVEPAEPREPTKTEEVVDDCPALLPYDADASHSFIEEHNDDDTRGNEDSVVAIASSSISGDVDTTAEALESEESRQFRIIVPTADGSPISVSPVSSVPTPSSLASWHPEDQTENSSEFSLSSSSSNSSSSSLSSSRSSSPEPKAVKLKKKKSSNKKVRIYCSASHLFNFRQAKKEGRPRGPPDALVVDRLDLCEVCHRGDDEDRMLLCDRCDNVCYYIFQGHCLTGLLGLSHLLLEPAAQDHSPR
jgi:hypothetical protein